jgi:hypothetical protein
MKPVMAPTKQQNEDDIKPASTFPWLNPNGSPDATPDNDPAIQPQVQPEPSVNPKPKTKVATDNAKKKRTLDGAPASIKGEDPNIPYVY